MWDQYKKPAEMKEALILLNNFMGSTKIIAGGTDLVLEFKKGIHSSVKTIIDISQISGLDRIYEEDGIIHLGPMVTHAMVSSSILIREKALPLLQACYSVGAPQIRNVGTVAGNIITASPANDTITALMALDAKVSLLSSDGKRDVPLNKFYTSVRKTIMRSDEILTDIYFPELKKNQTGCFLKFGLRKAQAVSLINVCAVTTMDEGIIVNAKITIGCVSPMVIHSKSAEEYLAGKKLTDAVSEEAGRRAVLDAVPIDDIRSSAEYRNHLVAQIVEQALTHIQNNTTDSLIPENPILVQTPSGGEADNSRKLTGRGSRDFMNGGKIRITVNGKEGEYKIKSGQTLIKFLRDTAGLKGAKESCGEGECGSCTVLLDGKAVMGCLLPVEAAEGKELYTVEDLAGKDKLHPVQQAFIEEGAVQCGYCTPGFLLVTKKLLEEKPVPTREDIITAVSGNVCRCTGYYKIIKAVEKSAVLMKQESRNVHR